MTQNFVLDPSALTNNSRYTRKEYIITGREAISYGEATEILLRDLVKDIIFRHTGGGFMKRDEQIRMEDWVKRTWK
jgi:hypothetical protein